jgi:hypothetical protein
MNFCFLANFAYSEFKGMNLEILVRSQEKGDQESRMKQEGEKIDRFYRIKNNLSFEYR